MLHEPAPYGERGQYLLLFAAKKDPDKLVLAFNVLPFSPLTTVMPLLNFAIEAAGAQRAPGTPPKGALFK